MSGTQEEPGRSWPAPAEAPEAQAPEAAPVDELAEARAEAASWKQRAEAAEAQTLRTRIAAAKGLPAGLAGRLRGSTEAELEADADELLAAFAPGNRAATDTPPRMRPGAVPNAAPSRTDGDPVGDMARRALGL